MMFIRLIKIEFIVNNHWLSDIQYYIGLFMGLLWRNILICENFMHCAREICQSKTSTLLLR